MASAIETPAFIILIMGLYALGAGIGEWRAPGFWAGMIDDFGKTPALRFLTGLICLALGAALYLVGGWDTADWMVIVIKVIGAWMIVEGFLFLALGDWFMAFARRLLGSAGRLWAAFSILFGIGLVAASLIRF